MSLKILHEYYKINSQDSFLKTLELANFAIHIFLTFLYMLNYTVNNINL